MADPKPLPGFIGPSYQLDNLQATIERTVNWHLTPVEDPGETIARMIFEPSPGNKRYSALPVPAPFNQPNRGLIEVQGNVYGVNGDTVFYLKPDGTYVFLGNVLNDGNPCSMVANGNDQVFISSAGAGYVIPAGTTGAEPLQPVTSSGFLGATVSTFQDGYILNILPQSHTFQISGDSDTPLGDATKWDQANVSIQAGQADLLVAALSTREYIWLLGQRRSQIYQNVGANGIGGFPFQSLNSTFIEMGCAAAFSLKELGTSVAWLATDERGRLMMVRSESFQPRRISTHATERFWKEYARVDDAVAFVWSWKGHVLYQITFPSAYKVDPPTGFPLGAPPLYHSATWVYDATVSDAIGRPIWFERSYQTSQGFAEGRSERFACSLTSSGNVQILVGSTGVDGNPGAIYQYDDTAYYDCGTDITGAQTQQQIVRDRISPHVWQSNKRVVYNRLELEMAKGIGLDGGVNPGSDPQVYMRYSDDGGKTWSKERNASAGPMGQYGQRIRWNSLGSGRNRVFWIRCTDPVYWSLEAALVDGFQTTV